MASGGMDAPDDTHLNSYYGILEIGAELLLTPFGKPPLILRSARE